MKRIKFQGRAYKLVFTVHAKLQMELRSMTEEEVVGVIENGAVKAKDKENKYWVYMSLASRKDNMISVSLSVESPHVIVITTMINWRPS